MENNYIICLDCGTQSTRGLVFDERGNLIFQAKRNMNVDYPNIGWVEQNLDQWWEAACSVLKEISEKVKVEYLKGLSIAFMRESFALIDRDGKALSPAILWNDNRSSQQVEQLKKEFGEQAFNQVTGKPLNELPSITKVRWLYENCGDVVSSSWKFVNVSSYLHYRLTGRMAAVVAGTDVTGMIDIRKRTWSPELVEYTGLRPDQLPELVESGEPVGMITKQAAELTGLPEGLPVIAGGGDGQAFAIGSGVASENSLVLNLGTAITGGVNSSRFATSPNYRTLLSCVPNEYFYELVLLSGCEVITWFVNQFAEEEKKNSGQTNISAETILEEQCAKIAPGSEGLLTLPFWRGSMMPYNDSNARGVTIGWAPHHTRAHFYRSILEGFAFEIRTFVDAICENLGCLPDFIQVGGGGANSREWRKILCDVTKLDLCVDERIECTSLGILIIAATGLGFYSDIRTASRAILYETERMHPDQGNIERYDRVYTQLYKKIYPDIREYSMAAGKLNL